MAKSIQIKTNFTAGEISPDLLGRGDLRAYDNGALELRNLFIHPTGGVKRRAGTKYIATLPGGARFIAYEYSTTQIFLLAFTHNRMDVYLDGAWLGNITAPWTSAQLDQINWAQSADALLIVHPDVAPKKITRSNVGVWTISDWAYTTNSTGDLSYQPFYRFAVPNVTLYSATTTGTATLTASSGIFSTDYIGVRLRIRNTQCTVTGYTNPTTVTVTIHGTLAASPATTDWAESAFSGRCGYPVSVAFHQDRLVIGGSRSLPNRLWLSRTGDLFNFDLGTGLDDEGIEFGILSDQINAIRAVVSGRHLQVFTSGAEWMVTGDPLTPTSLQLKRQTRVGSVVDRTVPPMDVEGATLFVARNHSEIREYLYTDLEQAYQSSDLALLCRHIISGVVDQAYDKARRLLIIVRDDGNFATLTMYRAEQVAAWTLHETDGVVKSVVTIGEHVYVQVYRNGAYLLEEISDEVLLDACVVASSGAATTIWSGLVHLNGKTVKILADGVPHADRVVSGGTITLESAAFDVQIGLPYTHCIKPLPPNRVNIPGPVRKIRLVQLNVRLQATQCFEVDLGRGLRAIALPGTTLPSKYSGDLSISGYGWRSNFDEPLWQIESDEPLSFNLLSITTETQVN